MSMTETRTGLVAFHVDTSGYQSLRGLAERLSAIDELITLAALIHDAAAGIGLGLPPTEDDGFHERVLDIVVRPVPDGNEVQVVEHFARWASHEVVSVSYVNPLEVLVQVGGLASTVVALLAMAKRWGPDRARSWADAGTARARRRLAELLVDDVAMALAAPDRDPVALRQAVTLALAATEEDPTKALIDLAAEDVEARPVD